MRQTVSEESIASSSMSHDDWSDYESQRRRSSTSGHRGHASSSRIRRLKMFPVDMFGMLLLSGCLLALLSQYMARKGVALPKTQLMTWTRFSFKWTCSAIIDLRAHRSSRREDDRKDSTGGSCLSQSGGKRQHLFIITGMGILDVGGYALSSFGFQALGSSLSIVIASALGQILTALTRRMILKRQLSLQQSIGVALVSVGLAIRGAGIQAGSSSYSSALVGFMFLFLSALCYALVGIGFEWVTMAPHAPDNSFIQRQMSMIGTFSTSLYILVYVLPHRKELIFDRIVGINVFFILLLYSLIGGIFTLHSFLQAKCIKSSGVVAVNIVNALRSVAVTLLSSLLFCYEQGDRECLTFEAIVGALVVCSGVAIFSISMEEKKKGREKKE